MKPTDTASTLVPFTQFLLPDGRAKSVSIQTDAGTAEKAFDLIRRGYRFECECLMTGEVSLTCESKNEDDGPIAIEICANGPAVPTAVAKLIDDAFLFSTANVVRNVSASADLGADRGEKK